MNPEQYTCWREQKLDSLSGCDTIPIIPVQDPERLSQPERSAMRKSVSRHNVIIYDLVTRRHPDSTDSDDKTRLASFCAQLGLEDPLHNPAADCSGISHIEAVDETTDQMGPADRTRYIPYTRRSLNWHTDGYYNPPSRKVRSFVLHCVRPAVHGGENVLLDPELLYIRMRDQEPALIRSLSHPETLFIPSDPGQNGGSGRDEFRGAVFSIDPETGSLYMRFTCRRHNISWRNDDLTSRALAFIKSYLDAPNADIHRIALQPGQGIVCNNVLHGRTAFRDGPGRRNGRLLYRLRFQQRIAAD